MSPVGAAVDGLQSLMKDRNAPQSVLDGTVIGRNCSATATRSSSASPTAGADVKRPSLVARVDVAIWRIPDLQCARWKARSRQKRPFSLSGRVARYDCAAYPHPGTIKQRRCRGDCPARNRGPLTFAAQAYCSGPVSSRSLSFDRAAPGGVAGELAVTRSSGACSKASNPCGNDVKRTDSSRSLPGNAPSTLQ